MDRFLTRIGTTPVVLAASALTATAAWAWLISRAATRTHEDAALAGTFGASVIVWQAMMIAMMTPAVAPWIGVYARFAGPGAGALGSTGSFAAGYFAVWLAYSVGAAALQLGLSRSGLLGHHGGPPWVAGGVLVASGAFQLLPVRQACLTHCRNPLSYLIARWRNGPPAAFRLGATHGAFCVGCCWLLMLTGFAMGTMNLGWMALLTVVVVVEQVAPGGRGLGRLFGAGLILWGARLAAAA